MAKAAVLGMTGTILGLIALAIGIFYTWMPFVSITYVLQTEGDHKTRRDYALMWGSIIAVAVIVGFSLLAFLFGGVAFATMIKQM